MIEIDTVVLHYPGLHVEFDYGPKDRETGYGKKWFDQDIEYDYEVDQADVEEAIANVLPEEEYDRIINFKRGYADSRDETDILYEYIHENFDKLFDQYEQEILDSFEDDAKEDAIQHTDPDDYGYDPFEESLKMNEDWKYAEWDADAQEKWSFLVNHKTYEGQFSRDCKVWDLGLTTDQTDYYGDFIYNGGLGMFWEDNKELSRDIFQAGRQGGHLILGGDTDSRTQPDYYDANIFGGDLDRAFWDWTDDHWGVYLSDLEDDEVEQAKKEFLEWLTTAYDAVVDFDERCEELIVNFRKALDAYIAKADPIDFDEDFTETVASQMDAVEDPEFETKSDYDEIDESYFEDETATDYTVEDDRCAVLSVFEDRDEAIDFAKAHFRDKGATLVRKNVYTEDGVSDEVIWTVDEALEWDEVSYEDDYLDELPELDEAVDVNPDFDDDFGGHSMSSYALFKAQEEEEDEWEPKDDEDSLEVRDPDRYDAKHAKEWMERHPNGWYNSESDYGVGDSDYDDLPEEDDDCDESLFHRKSKIEKASKSADVQDISDILEPLPDGDDDSTEKKADGRYKMKIREDVNGQVIEFECGKYFTVERNGDKLIAGSATNTGIIPEFEIEYDENKSEDENLQDLYDKIVEEHPEFLSASCDESLKECTTPVQEAVHYQDAWNYYSLRNQYDEQVAFCDTEEDAIQYAEEEDDDIYKIVHITPNPKDDKVIWTKKQGRLNEAVDLKKIFKRDKKATSQPVSIGGVDDCENCEKASSSTKPGRADNRPRLRVEKKALKSTATKKLVESAVSEEDIRTAVSKELGGSATDAFFDLVVDLVDRAISDLEMEDHDESEDLYQTVAGAVDEGLVYTRDEWEVLKHYCSPANADLQIATEDLISDVVSIVDSIKDLHYFDESLKEGAMSELDIEAQEAGGQDELVQKLQYEVGKLKKELDFLTKQAPREVSKGGAFDSQEEINDAVAATERALRTAQLKLSILRGTQNG